MSNQSSTGGEKGVGDNKLMFEALLSEMSKRLSAEMELVHERMDKIEKSKETTGSTSIGQKHERFPKRGLRIGEEGDIDSTQRRDGNVGSIKMKIPSFQGKNDPELYLE